MKFKITCFCLLTLFSITTCSCVSTKKESTGAYTRTIQQLSSSIKKQMHKHKIQGLSIALVDDEKLVWAEGFGYADVANKAPATVDTIYKVASITKLFTATSIMQLAEAGKIVIDQPLTTYLSGFSIKSRFPHSPITPRNVMSHHSGLPSDLFSFIFNDNPPRFTKAKDALKNEYLAFPPNYIFSYSNIGYFLLGHLIEKVTGEDYTQFVQRNILYPLAMESSSFQPTTERLAKCYRGGKPMKESSHNPLPAGGLYSTVRDLSRLISMVFAHGTLDGQRILAPDTLAEMLTPQNEHVPLDLDIKIGLGWFLGGQDLHYAGKTLAHGGSINSYHSQLTILPNHKLGVVVLSNSHEAAGIVEEIATEALRLALEEKTGIRPPPARRTKTIKLSQRQLEQEQGYYASSAGLLSFKAGRGGLFTSLGGTPLKLVPLSDNSFIAKYSLWGLFTFSLPQLSKLKFSFCDIGSKRVLILENKGERMVFGEKVQPQPIGEVWEKRKGKYQVLDKEGSNWLRDVALTVEDGFLTLSGEIEGIGQLKAALLPFADTAMIMGLGRNTGDTVRFETIAGQEIMFYSGYRFRKKE